MEVFLCYRERRLSCYRDEFLKSTQQNLVYRCVNLHSILEKVILLTSQNSSFYCQHIRPVTFSFHYTFDKKIYNISVWGTRSSQFAMQWTSKKPSEVWNSHKLHLKTQVPNHRQHCVCITKTRLVVVFQKIIYISSENHAFTQNAKSLIFLCVIERRCQLVWFYKIGKGKLIP